MVHLPDLLFAKPPIDWIIGAFERSPELIEACVIDQHLLQDSAMYLEAQIRYG